MRGGERIGEHRAEARDQLGEHCAALGELLAEALAAHELHDDERRPVATARRRARCAAAHVEHPQDVRMLERRRRARLALEPPHHLVALGQVREQHLDRHVAPQVAVACAKHRGHAALADLLDELVAPERVAYVNVALRAGHARLRRVDDVAGLARRLGLLHRLAEAAAELVGAVT